MGRLIMWNVLTLDGRYDAEEPWALPWHETLWGAELEQLSLDQLRGASWLVFGRRTYEGMAAYWRTADGPIAELMNSLPKLVFSRDLTTVDWNNAELASGPPADVLPRLKSDAAMDLYVFGSGNLSQSLAEAGLFDLYRLAFAPRIHGGGKLLFPDGFPKQNLKLTENRSLETGGILVSWEVLGP